MKQRPILLIILFLSLFFSSCHREQKLAVAEKLQEKYGEEFKVVDARYSVITRSYSFTAYPRSNKKMQVTGIHNADLSYFSDSYTSQLISEDYHSYLQKRLEEADYFWDSKNVYAEDSPTGVFHLETHLNIFDELEAPPESFNQDYTFRHHEALSLDMVIHISTHGKEPLQDHRGLELLYSEYLRLLEHEKSFLTIEINQWNADSLSAYLLREMRLGHGIPSEFHPESILRLYIRTDEYAFPMSYNQFLLYLEEAKYGKDFINLNERMNLCSFDIVDLQRIFLTDYVEKQSSTMEIYRGYKEGQLYSSLYLEDAALEDNLRCYRFLQKLMRMKSPELLINQSPDWTLKRQWVFQEKEVESFLKIYQNANGEWFGTSTNQPYPFRIPTEYLEELMNFPYLP